jgi:sensor histidine kinase YesM
MRRVAPLIPRSRQSWFWLLQIGGWSLAVPVFITVLLTVFNDFLMAVVIGCIRQIIGFGITLVLWRIYRRWPPAQFQIGRHVWLITSCCVAATMGDFFLSEVIRRVFLLPELPEYALRGSVFVRLAVYVAWSALYFAIRQELEARDTALRLAQAEAANREAEIQLLRAQVNPHFLFNALNSIIGQAPDNPAAVVETTHAVADYLRYSLSQNAHRAALGDELDALANFLRVERMNRGESYLEWRIDATPEARAALAPTALVQPLVENAIKYGLKTSPRPLRLQVDAKVTGGELVVLVENTGRWLAPEREDPGADSTGIGFHNVRRRLALLCGDKASLQVRTPEGFVQVEAHLPLVAAPAKPESPLR